MSGYRLGHGGDIDRTRPITFQWEGRNYSGFAGDTLASALLASGVRMMGRSFKYHRPRGLIAAGLDEPNAIVQLEQGAQTIPNLKAPYIDLYDGLSANPVNAWPSLGIPVHSGTAPAAALGGRALRGVRIGRVSEGGHIEGATQTLRCDTLLVSGGWNPAVHLHSHGAGRLALDANLHSFTPIAAAGHRHLGAHRGRHDHRRHAHHHLVGHRRVHAHGSAGGRGADHRDQGRLHLGDDRSHARHRRRQLGLGQPAPHR